MDNKIVLGIIVALVLVVGGYLMSGNAAEVSAQGQAVIKVQPDLSVVYVNAESRANTAEEAHAKQSEISDNVLTNLIKAGIAKEDIQTLNYQVYQDYTYTSSGAIPKGFVSNQQIIVKTTDMDKTSKIVDAVIDAGALVSSINFELSPEKQTEYKQQALTEAGEDAEAKAEAIALGVDKKLGRLTSVQSQDFSYNPGVYYSKSEFGDSISAREAALSISPRELDVSATIIVTYKLR